MSVSGKVSSADLLTMLRGKYPAPEYAFFAEVPSGTGGPAARTADAIAMALWPSRGLELLGFEVKVSRADWLRELRRPEKADRFVGVCDRWYVVVAEETIIQVGELPPTWGLMVPRGGKLVVRTEAPKLMPPPVDRAFLASLLRRVHSACPAETALRTATEAGRKAGYAEGMREGKAKAGRENEFTTRELAELRQAIATFEAESGVKFSTYRAGEIGKAVRLVMDGGAANARRTIGNVAVQVSLLHALLQETVAEIAADGGVQIG